MATKTFSSRADEDKIALADALSQRKFGMSFGKYCGTMLLDAVCANRAFPDLKPHNKDEKIDALDYLRNFAEKRHDPEISALSDHETRTLIGRRHE